MIPFEITREDLLQSKTVTPGWYVCQVTEVAEGAAGQNAKNPGSRLITIKLKILIGSGGDESFKDVIVKTNFSEVAPGFAAPFLSAVNKKDVQAGKFNLAMADGRKLWVFVKNGMWNGKKTNNAEGYLAYEEGQTQPVIA